MFKHSVTREYSFSYGHRLWDETYTDETNDYIFGKCCNNHGHNGKVFVTVEGPLYDGMVMNFNAMDKIIKPIVDEWDHKFLNTLDDFKDMIPTAEHMAEILYKKIRPHLDNLNFYLRKVKVYENDKSAATYRET